MSGPPPASASRDARPPGGRLKDRSIIEQLKLGQQRRPPEREPGAERRRRSGPRRIDLLHPGWIVVAVTFALCAVGIYCIDIASGLEQGRALSGDALRQLEFVVVAVVGGVLVAVPHFRIWVTLAWPAGICAVLLLAILLVPGMPESIISTRKGARRWIDLGPFDLQPSELAKLAYVLVTAAYLRYRKNHRTLLGLVTPGVIVFVPMVLILVEPDLGTSLLFLPTLVAMLVAAGARLKHLFAISSLGLVMALIIAAASLVFAEKGEYPLLRKHQVERIQALLEAGKPGDRYADDRGYQGRQAMTLVGAGQLEGHDELHSRALVHFSRLPERRNDMVFAVFANRFGFTGTLWLLGLYALWAFAALWVAGACKDAFGRLVVVGFTAMTSTQMLINIGECVGVLPITGMTLPFVSYGGSSLVVGFLMVGLIVNIAMRRPEMFWKKSFEFDEQAG